MHYTFRLVLWGAGSWPLLDSRECPNGGQTESLVPDFLSDCTLPATSPVPPVDRAWVRPLKPLVAGACFLIYYFFYGAGLGSPYLPGRPPGQYRSLIDFQETESLS
jgi:hypothetical protein